jgi:hypothetical protein
MKRAGVLFLVILATLVAACGLGDTQSSSYADHDAAVADGAIARGWIPAFLPRSATDLHEKHNLYTNASLLRFDFAPGDLESLAQACPAAEDTVLPRLSAGWWPADLRDGPIVFLQCQGAYLVTDATELRAYFWRP